MDATEASMSIKTVLQKVVSRSFSNNIPRDGKSVASEVLYFESNCI